ncbi:NAD-dependent epimerase/dehydratase family protein [Metabacillus indicus]|uniref:NAD-dependent epimerase/dehydratase family protein n=1 Tax=Metabacillus indicus TaxID=246786 RepID=UPI002A0127E1|nr:NAD-dependent epimerase/dehydratase family protein [Metabacillus indicus]MDX8289642.1 NAD-dependent epimerase/dehydratase family protein [Metabacillus indicus]
MNILVTGCAGFIGSHLCEKLLENEAHTVTGIDCMIGPVPEPLKNINLHNLLTHPRFQLIRKSIMEIDCKELIEKADVVYHLAGIPGVRSSWGKDFHPYAENNILATQKLLEAAKGTSLKKFIYASTSSIYGYKHGKVSEDAMPDPLSPYGVTKLAGEHLCSVYNHNFGVPAVILRYFTVYGPRQRPDMAFHRFFKQIMTDQPLTLFGDGSQTRDFTYIDDCVKGTAAVMNADDTIGRIFNIGGKERASVIDLIREIELITGRKADIQFLDAAIGEPKHTHADISLAKNVLGYSPDVPLKEGLRKEYDYMKRILLEDPL